MIESATFTNVNGASVEFNDLNIPFERFTTDVDTRFTEKSKSQEHGIFETNTYFGKRLFHCEGDILADDSSDYWVRRMALINAILPRPQLGQSKAGTLDLMLSGMVEPVSADCTIDGYPDLPLEALS